MPKIKSINTLNSYHSSDIAIITENDNEVIVEYPDHIRKNGALKKAIFDKNEIEIEYESEILKRPDGSVVSGLEEGEKVWILKTGFLNEDGDEGYFSSLESYRLLEHKIYLKKGYIFEKKDVDLAEKKAKMLEKKLKIQYEIDRFNAEDTEEKNKMLCFFIGNKKVTYVYMNEFERINNPGKLISTETAETILAKYSQDELKQYLGIII